MTPAAFAAELSAVLKDPRLVRTNPVWCLDQLVARWSLRDTTWVELSDRLSRLIEGLAKSGGRLPRSVLNRWAHRCGPLSVSETTAFGESPTPGVLGLIVETRLRLDAGGRDVFVVPLVAERAGGWAVAPTLPMQPAAVLQDLLLGLLRALRLPHLGGVPERFAYSLSDPLGIPSGGRSMHVAGLLSVIREANGCPRELDRACAVVQPDGDHLVPVDVVAAKLEAVRRECGSGTLMVRGRGCSEAAKYDSFFDDVWQVDTLADLARECERRGWLGVFLADCPLSSADAETVFSTVRRLEAAEHRYAEALELSSRAERCGFEPQVSARARRDCRQYVIDLCRHLGAYRRSAELAEEEYRRSRTSRAASYEEQALADVTYAAALYAPHRFDEMHRLLEPWREKLVADPLLLTALTRVKVFNTLGRAWVACGRDGWEDLFRRSAELLTELEPTDLPRTWCYLAQGYLRAGRTEAADELLRLIEAHPGLSEMSRWSLRALQADSARRRGETWVDPEIERMVISGRVGHPFGFYLQATARQPSRGTDDALDRFRRARGFLGQDDSVGDGHNIQRFLTECISLAEAAWSVDQERWSTSLAAIERYLAPQSGVALRDHYAGHCPTSDTSPSQAAAERLLSRVPFF